MTLHRAQLSVESTCYDSVASFPPGVPRDIPNELFGRDDNDCHGYSFLPPGLRCTKAPTNSMWQNGEICQALFTEVALAQEAARDVSSSSPHLSFLNCDVPCEF